MRPERRVATVMGQALHCGDPCLFNPLRPPRGSERATPIIERTIAMPNIDPRLLATIEEGRCVAFVGAGFSAAAGLPQWEDLIRAVAGDLPPHERGPEYELVVSMLDDHPAPSSRELAMAAQLLFDAHGEDAFRERLALALRREPLPEAMRLRLKHLYGIPFRAILTTNFDPLLPGPPPGAEAYRKLLRGRRPSPWREALARVALDLGPLGGLPADGDAVVIQLHGRLDVAQSLVLTRAQYQRRLYADPAYLTVLRALFATYTVLFLGYSLNDAYLNELRSELVEAFAGSGRGGEPLAWAVIEGVSEVACRYYERHEGLGVVAYRSGDRGRDHAGFDAILKAIYDQTNPIQSTGWASCSPGGGCCGSIRTRPTTTAARKGALPDPRPPRDLSADRRHLYPIHPDRPQGQDRRVALRDLAVSLGSIRRASSLRCYNSAVSCQGQAGSSNVQPSPLMQYASPSIVSP